MLDYKELSINPYHLNRNKKPISEFMNEAIGGAFAPLRGEAGRGTGWSSKRLLRAFGGDGREALWGGVKESRRELRDEREATMLDEINKLILDPDTGLPILPNIAEQIDVAREERGKRVFDLQKTAETQADKFVANMYKSGAITHGKTVSAQRDLSEKFQKDIGSIATDFKQDLGTVEETAFSELDVIKKSIDDVENVYDTTDYGSSWDFENKRYDTSVNPEGKSYTKPKEDVIEKMFEFDYMTGKKKRNTGV
tara:strand:- start:19121 stop:19879 length:759 start_codon:yes stop_codon:yes gene_type:complete